MSAAAAAAYIVRINNQKYWGAPYVCATMRRTTIYVCVCLVEMQVRMRARSAILQSLVTTTTMLYYTTFTSCCEHIDTLKTMRCHPDTLFDCRTVHIVFEKYQMLKKGFYAISYYFRMKQLSTRGTIHAYSAFVGSHAEEGCQTVRKSFFF